MKTTKILSFVAGLSMLAATFVPVKVNAASVSLSLSGATNTSGTFSAIVYENSDAAHVTTAKIDLGFSGTVSNISYDYSVGPFSNPTPSGAGATQGYVTGSQPVARVSFKLANPGSVTTSVGGSYLKGTSDDGTQVINHSVSGGSATFVYNAPAATTPPTTTTTPSTTAPTTKSSTSTNSSTAKTSTTTTTPSSNGTVAGDETTTANAAASTTDGKKDTTKKSTDKKADAKNTSNSSKPWMWVLLIVAAALAGFAAARFARARRAANKVAAEKVAAASAVAAKAKNVKAKKTSRA